MSFTFTQAINNQNQPPAPQQQQAPGVANQQTIEQHQADIGQVTNATPGSLPSYGTMPPDQGVDNDGGKYSLVVHGYHRNQKIGYTLFTLLHKYLSYLYSSNKCK